MIQDLSNNKAFVELAEAKRQGHNFMKIYLHRSKIGRGERKIIISGAVTLQGFRRGFDQFGGDSYEFVERRGDSMVFEFDENEREFICWLYDDPGRGYFSPNGYNRDLLASHWEENFFIIKDPEVYADVKLRYEYLKSNPKKLEIISAHVDVNRNISSGMTVDEIESQIDFLLQRKEQIIKINSENQEEEILKAKVYEQKKAEKEAEENAKASRKKPIKQTIKEPEESLELG